MLAVDRLLLLAAARLLSDHRPLGLLYLVCFNY
jgi:hypothetical protein